MIAPLLAALPLLATDAVVGQDTPPLEGGPAVQVAQPGALERLRATALRVQGQIETLRGRPFKAPVLVERADRETFVRYARRQLEVAGGAERLRQDAQVAWLLGLVPGEMDLEEVTYDVLEEQVGGFYDPREDTFYVMDWLADELLGVIVAHEFTHALDDQYHDLDGTMARLSDNTDALLALHAVVEGSGMELMFEWAQEHLTAEEFGEVLRIQSELPDTAVSNAPPFVWKPLVAIYYQGQSFLRRQARVSPLGGPARTADIERAFEDPPRSTEQVLHPVKYWESEHVDEPRHLTFDAGRLPEGWRVLREDTFGELYAALLTTPFEDRAGMNLSVFGLLGLRFTNDAATGWGGDRYLLLEKDGGLLLCLESVWDSVKDAEEFAAAVDGLVGDVQASKARREGHDPDATGFEVRLGEGARVSLASWAGLSREDVRAALEALVITERQ